MDQTLIQLIQGSAFLSQGDKSFLIEKVAQMNPLEKLKLQQSLAHGQAPNILQSLQVLRAKFFESERPKEPDLLTKVASAILPKQPRKVLNTSILTNSNLLGGPVPQAVKPTQPIPQLHKLSDFVAPEQLSMLQSRHVTFDLHDNVDHIMQDFLRRLDAIFHKIENVQVRRNYFMNFLQSQLYASYMNTGLTALRHPELEPAKIILNLLYQINPNYLNNKQFHQAALISSHLRSLCAL